MEILAAIEIWSLLSVALGLGLVIFFHELGHFMVAKWCDVNVERFSIGFGPILLRKKWGETEYALSAVPFGGYVKMLGQDDIDPSQLTSEEISRDPRSYSAKPVWQRMAIISAGVTMNIITGCLFFAAAYGSGVESLPPRVGAVVAGYPAWEAGFERGDRIDKIDGRDVSSFSDIVRRVALSSGPIEFSGIHADGTTFVKSVKPDRSGLMPSVGIRPMPSVQIAQPADGSPPVIPEGPAATAEPPFKPLDIIRKIDDTEIKDYAMLVDTLAVKSSVPVDYYVERSDASELVKIHVGPNHFRTLGLSMDIGPLAAIREDSPAALAGLRKGDKIVRVDGRSVGTDLNPLELPDYFAKRMGEEVVLDVARVEKGSTSSELRIPVRPQNSFAWTEPPAVEEAPVSVPSLGLAFHVTSTVLKVQEGSPAAQAGIQPRTRINKVRLLPPTTDSAASGQNDQGDANPPIELEKIPNWAFAFWNMQVRPLHRVQLTLVDADGNTKVVELKSVPAENWYVYTRGIELNELIEIQKAGSFSEALVMGWTHTSESVSDTYLMLRNLVGGVLSVKNVHGPIGIAKIAYTVAESGFANLMLFLGVLSINLAVLNFLPIPVLDGGHMVFLIWEGISRRRPSEQVVVAATYVGIAFVLGLLVFVIYLDLFVHTGILG